MNQLADTPVNQILSTFKSSNSMREAFDAGLRSLVEKLPCDRASLILAYDDKLRLSNQCNGQGKTGTTGMALDLRESAVLMMSALQLNGLESLTVEAASSDKWVPYFELIGSEFNFHEIILLRGPTSAHGLLSLESNQKAEISEQYLRCVTETADLFGVLKALDARIMQLESAAM